MVARRRDPRPRGLAAVLPTMLGLALAAGLGLVAGAVLAPATPAYAHAALLGTEPATGSELDTPPAQVRLRFSERVSVSPDGVALSTGDGEPVATEPAAVDPDTPTEVVLPVPPDLADGTYLVTFRVVSADSHPVSGALVFSVGVPVGDVTDVAPAGDDPALVAVFTGARWAGFAGLALFTGALLVFVGCWPAGRGQPRARRLLGVGWLLSLASAAAALLLQGPYAAGRTLAGVADPALLADTFDTDFGRYALARLVLLVAAAGLLAGPLTRRPRAWRAAALTTALALPPTWVGTGHSNTGGVLDAAVDTVHLLAMTGWFGGLVLLAACLLPRSAGVPTAEVAAAVRRFSLLATGSVTTLVVTGVWIAWREVGSFAALAGTTYGRLLAFKLAAVGLLLWFGAYSRAVVRRRYGQHAGTDPAAERAAAEAAVATAGEASTGAPTGPGSGGRAGRSRRRAAQAATAAETSARGQLRQSVRLEVVTAAGVLAVVAVLVATPPGVVVTAEAADPLAELEQTEPVLVTEPFPEPAGIEMVRAMVDPARVGENRVVISVWDEIGERWDVPEVRADLSLPEQGLGPLALELEQVGPGEFETPAAQLPAAGEWELVVTVRTSEIDSTTVTLAVPVS